MKQPPRGVSGFANVSILSKEESMNRSKQYYREQSERAAKRKYRILTEVYGDGAAEGYMKNGSVNSLSKAKVHCSCWMCREGKDAKVKLQESLVQNELNQYGFRKV